MSVTTPDPTLEFLGLFADQDEPTILARMQAWANEGLDPIADADAWVDTREGGHWQTVLMSGIREIARVYDVLGTEVPMSAFVLWAWGTYLDDLAAIYEVERLTATFATGIETFTGPNGTVISAGTTISASPSTPDDPAPAFVVMVAGTIAGGHVDLPIQAQDAGESGNVGANAITIPGTPLPGVTFTNAAATLGGSDPENDDALRKRVLAAVAGKGPGTQRDYVQWAGAIPGVGKVYAVPIWRGPNTVLVMVTDEDGQPLPGGTVTIVQNDLDPVAGQGAGTAPVGATVTVETSIALVINVAATIEYADGYSADGAAGTIAVRPGLLASIAAYLLGVQPGDEVVIARVAGLIATEPGVHDVSGVTLNLAGVNVDVALDPPQAPQLGTLTI